MAELNDEMIGNPEEEDVRRRKAAKRMSGRQKAAALLINLGAEACAEIFKLLKDSEVERLASTIARMDSVEHETLEPIIEEFTSQASADLGSSQGGMSFATQVLNQALGEGNSMERIERITSSAASLDLFTATPSSTELLLEMIRDEHPQTIALILIHVQEQRAAEILTMLPQEQQLEVITRIANTKAVSPEVITQIEEALQEKSYGHERVSAGGAKDAAKILNRADASVEKWIMESITRADPTLAEEISDFMFTYDDVIQITDTGIQRLIQELNENDLIMALRASTDIVKNKFLKNMSERRRQGIQEDLENLPPVRLKDVLAAQRRILSAAKELSQSGIIEIVREKQEEVFV